MSDLFLRPLFTWRSAVASEFGPESPTTRHVLLTLSLHMNEKTEGAYPSTKLLAKETALSERSVCTHLEAAEKAGWIMRKDRFMAGQQWKHHVYTPVIPIDVVSAFANSGKVLKEVQHLEGTERRSATQVEALNVVQQGTERDDKKALNDVQSSSSRNSTKNSKGDGQAVAAGSRVDRKTPIPEDFKLTEAHRQWARENGFEQLLEAHFAYFVDVCNADRTKRRYTDWDSAFRGAVRSDWGDIRKSARLSMGRGAPQAAPLEWWKSKAGLDAKARELGVERKTYPGAEEHQQQTLFVYDVYAAAGDGPWLNKRSDSEQRLYREACERRTKATA